MSNIIKQPLNEPEKNKLVDNEKTGCCYKFANCTYEHIFHFFRLIKTFNYFLSCIFFEI